MKSFWGTESTDLYLNNYIFYNKNLNMSFSFILSRCFTWKKSTFRLLLCFVLNLVWLSSCRSHVMPCPSFSQVTKEEAYQIGNGPAIKFDKHGRVKK